MSRTERILAIAIAALLVIIVSGTSFAVISGSRGKKLARDAIPAAEAAGGVYDGLGRVRAKTTDSPEAIVIVDIAFPYDSSDRQFREELFQKRGELKAAAMAFLSSKSAEDLHPSNEAAVKAAMRDTLNGFLSLGRIEELYFSEFRVIE